ncbi:MAG TPA: acyltransferase, partial [Polyangium sp.]|nr:acyltransferase [Polyangium sp.]
RHAKGVAGGGGGDGLKPCCDALAQNANSAPPDQKGSLLAAAATCRSLLSNPQGRALLGQVRAALAAAQVPSSCK